jgi:hypothetical protein
MQSYEFVTDEEGDEVIVRQMVTIQPRPLAESKGRKVETVRKVENRHEHDDNDNDDDDELRREDFTLRTLEASTETVPMNNNKVESLNQSENQIDFSISNFSTLERTNRYLNQVALLKVNSAFIKLAKYKQIICSKQCIY